VLNLLLVWLLVWGGSVILATLNGPPIIYSSYKGIRDSFSLARLKKGETVVDLGCGNGRTLLVAVKEFGAKGIGIDRSLYCVLKAKLNIYLKGESKNIKIYYKPLQKAAREIKQADVVYLYLWPSTMQKIEPWLFDQLSDKTRIVSLAFQFGVHKPVAELDTLNLGIKTKIGLYRNTSDQTKNARKGIL